MEHRTVVLCEFLLREFLNNPPDEISAVFDAYGDNVRDLYDSIILSVHESPDHMRSKRTYTRINNISNEYARIKLESREFGAPPGVKVFKAIGEIRPNGVYGAYPSLLPAKAPPALSPDSKRVVRFPPGIDPNDKKGVVSLSSPQPAAFNWPPAQRIQGGGSRGNTHAILRTCVLGTVAFSRLALVLRAIQKLQVQVPVLVPLSVAEAYRRSTCLARLVLVLQSLW